MPEKRLPVWETYSRQIANMRQQGYTLQEISDTVGVTRERIRQILWKHYRGIEPLLVPEQKVARIIGCSTFTLQKLRKSGVINPRHSNYFYLYSRDDIEKATLVLQRSCPHCGKTLPMKHLGKHCSECKAESRRYNYPFLSDDARRRANERSKIWQKEHPKQSKVIVNRATKKYSAKWKREHYAKTEYVVVRGKLMPIGSVFYAIGFANGYLMLENGAKISIRHVTKVKEGV